MAILIADEENQAREALREILNQMGNKVILEAKSGEEVLRALHLEKSRIEFIISEFNLSGLNAHSLAEKLNQNADLAQTPCVILTSSLTFFGKHKLLQSFPRIDACLSKPFRKKALEKSMQEAHAHRCSSRNKLLFIGKEVPSHISLKGSIWQEILHIDTSEKLNDYLNNPSTTISAFLLQPHEFDPREKIELSKLISKFKKTPLGTTTPIVSLNLNPEEIFHFRTLCQFFSNPMNATGDWQKLLKTLQNYLLMKPQMEIKLQQIRSLISQHLYSEALKNAQTLVHLAPKYWEPQSVLGEIYQKLNFSDKAIIHFRKAIDLNPTLPRPYIHLLSLLPTIDPIGRLNLAQMASEYCPLHTELGALFSQTKIELEEKDRTPSK